MSLRDDIQTGLREVIASLGETWQYRRRTSGPANPTQAFGAWTNVTACPTAMAGPPEYDEDRRTWKRTESLSVRVSDAVADLYHGDQFKDTAGLIYAVVGVASAVPNTGTVRYDIERTEPRKAESANRRGKS